MPVSVGQACTKLESNFTARTQKNTGKSEWGGGGVVCVRERLRERERLWKREEEQQQRGRERGRVSTCNLTILKRTQMENGKKKKKKSGEWGGERVKKNIFSRNFQKLLNMFTYSQSVRNHERLNPSRPAFPDHSLFLVNHQHYKPVVQAFCGRQRKRGSGGEGERGKEGKEETEWIKKKKTERKGSHKREGREKKQGTEPRAPPLQSSAIWLQFYFTSPKTQSSLLFSLPHLAVEARPPPPTHTHTQVKV